MREFKSRRSSPKFYIFILTFLIVFFILDSEFYLIDRCFEYIFRRADIILVPEIYDSTSDDLYMYTFDVGQSESILLLYQGNSILIDSATVDYAYPLVQTLKKLGIKNLDYCIFTHPHYDHMGGSSAILTSFEPSKVYVTKYDYNSLKKWWFEVYQKTIAYTDTSPEILSKGDIIGINDLKLHVISPISNSYENLNDYSIGIKASLQDIDILLLGDSEASAEHDLIESEYLLESEILKVSHHGSTTSSTQEFLAKVLPDYAIISVGKNNPYGHPKKSTLQKLSSIGAKIYRTDQNGTILIITDGKNINVQTNN